VLEPLQARLLGARFKVAVETVGEEGRQRPNESSIEGSVSFPRLVGVSP
jgi:hypothetical protein